MEEKKIRALLVEGDPTERDMIKLALERIGCNVLIADNGNGALTLFKKYHPHIMIVDMLIPELNGIDLLKDLRDQELLKNTIVIVISVLGFEEVILKAREAGAWDYVLKPFDVDVLMKRVRILLAYSAERGLLSA
jgi:two-component system alkaline phosphatase synthesis response regulator PhoP